MVKLVHIEFSKLKRRKVIPILMIVSNIIPLVLAAYFAMLSKGSPIVGSFPSYYKMTLGYTGLLILPCMVSVLFVLLFSLERTNDVLKQLFIVPVMKIDIILAKFLTVSLLSIGMMLTNIITIIIGGLCTGKFDITWLYIRRVIFLSLGEAILIPLSCLPILFLAIISRNVILPICLAIIYSFIGFIAAENLVGIHPVLSSMNIIFYNNIEGLEINGNIYFSLLNLFLVGFISMLGAIFIFERQDY